MCTCATIEKSFQWYLEKCPQGKLPPVGVRVWVRFRVRFRVEGQFSSGTIVLVPLPANTLLLTLTKILVVLIKKRRTNCGLYRRKIITEHMRGFKNHVNQIPRNMWTLGFFLFEQYLY